MSEGDCIAFVDLDDTLFSSLRRHETQDDLTPAATLTDGSVICYANTSQRHLFTMLRRHAAIVPVTARNMDALGRVILPLNGLAICSHGATLTHDGRQIDDNWHEIMKPCLVAARDSLSEFLSVAQEARDPQGNKLHSWLVGDGNYAAYAVVKHPKKDDLALLDFARTTAAVWLQNNPGFRMHINGNNIAMLPPGVSKAAAVKYLITQLRGMGMASVVIGAGDSNTDHEFLDLCDFMLLPTKSQLADTLRNGALRKRGEHDQI